MAAHEARISGLRFIADGRSTTDRDPFTLDDDALSAWFTTPDMRREMADRPTAHGQFPAQGYLSGRVLPLSGQIQTSSLARYEKAISDLSGVLAGGGIGRLTVDLELGTTWADVYRHGKPDIKHLVYGQTASYQMFLWAPMPQRYGETRTFPAGTSATVHHYGNFDAIPKVTVTGTGVYTITDGTKQLVVTSAIAPGQTDVIDFAKGWVYRNGVLLFGATSRAETITVPPGLPRTTLTISGGPSMTVAVTDTWV